MVYKIKLKIENFNNLTKVPKILNSMFQKTEKYNKSLAKMREGHEKLLKAMKKNHASSGRIWMVQKKMAIQQALLKARNPWTLLTAGVKLFGKALKGAGIGLALAALAGIVALGKKAFDFNIGGSKEGFFKVLGAMKDALGKFMRAFHDFIRALDPVLKPITEFFVEVILKGIKGIQAFGSNVVKALGGTKGLVKSIGGFAENVKELFVTIIGAFKQLVAGFGGGGEVAKGFATILKVLMGTLNIAIKLITAFFKILKFLQVFRVIGFAIGTIVKTFTALYNIITKVGKALKESLIGQQVMKQLEFWKKTIELIIKGLTMINDFRKQKNEENKARAQNVLDKIKQFTGGNKSVSNSVNNNLTVNTQSLDQSNAEGIANMMANTLAKARFVEY